MINSATIALPTPASDSADDNVRKCPVLSGLYKAPTVLTINPLYQRDLQHFSSCGRPDMPDIRPARLRVRQWLPGRQRRPSPFLHSAFYILHFLCECPETIMSFVRSSQRYPGYHPQRIVPKRLTAIYIVQPTGHTGHSPEKTGTPRC